MRGRQSQIAGFIDDLFCKEEETGSFKKEENYRSKGLSSYDNTHIKENKKLLMAEGEKSFGCGNGE